jgi:hypothetical protein
MLIEHHPSYLNYSAVLLFHDSILLWNTWGRELLINNMLKTKLIKRGIPKLGLILNTNGFQQLGCSLFNLKTKLQKCSNTPSLLSEKKTQK